MDDRIDLHIHSSMSSDGNFPPSRLLELARETGLRAIAISDHDTVAAYPEAVQLGREAGVEVIPNIEVTTLFEGREFHLLLPFVDWENCVIHYVITKVAQARVKEAKERIRLLQEIGFDISWEEVMPEWESTPPLGVSIAQVLLGKPASREDSRLAKYFKGKDRLFAPYIFYKDYFMEGRPAYVPKKTIGLLEVLAIAPETGGVPVLAHPGAYFQQTTEEDLALLKEKGLIGLEVYSSYHNRKQVKHYKKLAEGLDLVPTAGSDFHGDIKPHISFGSIREGAYWMVEELRKRRG